MLRTRNHAYLKQPQLIGYDVTPPIFFYFLFRVWIGHTAAQSVLINSYAIDIHWELKLNSNWPKDRPITRQLARA